MLKAAEELVNSLAVRGKMIAAAESCTAGLAADLIGCVPGASKVFWGSFVTYSADAKLRMLGVKEELIKAHGAVSADVALAMVNGALEKSGASLAFSITGLAGPDGDGRGTPVGTVWVAIAGEDGKGKNFEPEAKMFYFTGSRNEIREAAALAAFQEILKKLLNLSPL